MGGPPALFLGEFGAASFVPGGGGGDWPSFGRLVWVEGGRVGGVVDGFPSGPSARWAVGWLQKDGEEQEDVLCFLPGPAGSGGVVGPPVLLCYLCGSPLLRRHPVVFLCVCGAGFVVGVCNDRATEGGGPASSCDADADADADALVGSSGGAGLVRVRGDRDAKTHARARPRAHGDMRLQGPARGRGRGRGRGGPGAQCARRRGHGQATPTPEGEGRRARSRVAAAAASYRPPPAEEEVAEGIADVQPPEREGVNQAAACVSENNRKLEVCYGEMVGVVQSVKELLAAQDYIRADADRRQHWSSVGARVRGLQSQMHGLLARYDALSDAVDTLRSSIRADGGYPVEPPPILATHPSSLASSSRSK